MWQGPLFTHHRCDPEYDRTTITIHRAEDAERVAANAKKLGVVRLSDRVFYPKGDSESAMQRIEALLNS